MSDSAATLQIKRVKCQNETWPSNQHSTSNWFFFETIISARDTQCETTETYLRMRWSRK